ncbi:ATP-binding cassette domain-containing protein [Sphingomonas sp. H39-1-10]|uniref:ATP-binding cassette domain-containing protein n=1 Tax=Sphingomonas pollutisoli TaxID=3030829 RepID=UPI0023B901B8|nr:ATP-binding cassette domain-containing protein [Sphingomonas pollutisoli]MDF0491443.1 ATP-binding cassette domain-containing protein [Sphingomonas pollutisoli]
MATLAATHDLVKRFGKGDPALDGVSIGIEPGRITGLVGPDGAGKTTLIRLLAGLLAADGGRIDVLGGPPGAAMDEIGYMPQRFGLYEDLSVSENLDLYADLRGLPRDEREETFGRLLDFTDLRRFQQRPAGKLSGGMKQKLGLACALIRTPRLLLLDEPSVGVDPVSRRELWAMMKELAGPGHGGGIAVLWSTAYLDEAERCDTVHLLDRGKLLFSGPPSQLTGRIAHRSFRLVDFAGERRPLLERVLDRDDVADATIQGKAIRLLVARNAEPPPVTAMAAGDAARLEPVPPRFEDGFVDILGGGPKGTSRLAQAYREIPRHDAPAIEADGLTRRFGDFTAAEDIRFTIGRGEIFGLLGPNGAGKSTTFKMLCGLLKPSAGTGSVAGFDLRRSAAQARGALGYMAQKFSLYGDLSVRQNLDFFAGVYGLDRAGARTAIERAVDIFDLGRFLGTNAGILPLGYKQRLALACAVMHEPPVLFLDEPTSGVDPITRREFWTHINGLVGKGVTVLVTTHFMDEAEYCDRVALIYRGREIATGSPDELKARAATEDGLDDPTMEDAFIALIEASDRAREGDRKEAA